MNWRKLYALTLRWLVVAALLMLPLAQVSANTPPSHMAMEAPMAAHGMSGSAMSSHATMTLNAECLDNCASSSGADQACLSHCLQLCATALAVISECQLPSRHMVKTNTRIADQKALMARSWFDPPPPRI